MADARRAFEPRISAKITRGESAAHGAGAFATETIAKGELIAIFTGRITHASEADFDDYHLQVGEEHFLGPSGDLDDLVNHSCEPNAGFSLESANEMPILIARRDIAPGEEITMDYNGIIDEAGWGGFACGCGASTCSGVVRSFRDLSDVKKQALKPWILPYLRDKYFR
jgi:SET domain-containing protein